MKLTATLRASFQKAYHDSFGIEIDAEQAEALGGYLLELAGTALTLRAKAIHSARVDSPTNKRHADGGVHTSPV